MESMGWFVPVFFVSLRLFWNSNSAGRFNKANTSATPFREITL
jgi:hypothetical protein